MPKPHNRPDSRKMPELQKAGRLPIKAGRLPIKAGALPQRISPHRPESRRSPPGRYRSERRGRPKTLQNAPKKSLRTSPTIVGEPGGHLTAWEVQAWEVLWQTHAGDDARGECRVADYGFAPGAGVFVLQQSVLEHLVALTREEICDLMMRGQFLTLPEEMQCGEQSLMPRPLILAGHSMGATSQILAAARLDPAPLGLALIEPVIMPATLRVLMHTPAGPAFMNRFPLVTNAKARKDGWADIEAVKARYSSKSTFSRWADGMLDDYLEDGLVEQDGEWHLACPPAWEAANFAAQRHAPIKAARQLRAPIHVLQAGHGSTLRDPKALLGAGAQIECAEEDGHLLAMESPDETRRWLSRTLTRLMAETDDGLAG